MEYNRSVLISAANLIMGRISDTAKLSWAIAKSLAVEYSIWNITLIVIIILILVIFIFNI